MTQISKRHSDKTVVNVSKEKPQIPKPPGDQSVHAEKTGEEIQVTQENQPPSIYDRLGREAIAAVGILHNRLFTHPELVPFFVNANMKMLNGEQGFELDFR